MANVNARVATMIHANQHGSSILRTVDLCLQNGGEWEENCKIFIFMQNANLSKVGRLFLTKLYPGVIVDENWQWKNLKMFVMYYIQMCWLINPSSSWIPITKYNEICRPSALLTRLKLVKTCFSNFCVKMESAVAKKIKPNICFLLLPN